MGFHLQTCARPNILALQPYRCARDDYKDDGRNILLDANENAFGPSLPLDTNGNLPNRQAGRANGVSVAAEDAGFDLLGLNRYPDPHQHDLKQLLCHYRTTHVHTSNTLRPENLFVGVGSDEAIDALLRCFCRPGYDKILTCPPTYGMYAVSAQVNDLEIVKIPLKPEANWAIDAFKINEALSADVGIKLIYLCSPGNPTAALLDKEDIRQILEHPTWNGVVVLDEAYVDFSSPESSLAEWVTEWPNLVVMQTLSKAFGLAGIRLGAAFASPEIAQLLNNVKAPYNVSSPTSALATRAMGQAGLEVMRENVARILAQRERLLGKMPEIAGIGRFIGGNDSNFLLVQILDQPRESGGQPDNEMAMKVYEKLAESRGVVVRFRGKETGCFGCLRVTVGTEEEVDRFLAEISSVLKELHTAKEKSVKFGREDLKEREANDVIA